MALPVKVLTTAQMLEAGDNVQLQGLVIAVEKRFDKVKVTFKGSRERVFPLNQQVILLVQVPPPQIAAVV